MMAGANAGASANAGGGGPLDIASLEPRTDREILLVIAGEMRHMRNHQGEMVAEAIKQNGRLGKLEDRERVRDALVRITLGLVTLGVPIASLILAFVWKSGT